MAETFKSIRNGKFNVNCIAVIQSSLFKNLFFFWFRYEIVYLRIYGSNFCTVHYSFLIHKNILCSTDQNQPWKESSRARPALDVPIAALTPPAALQLRDHTRSAWGVQRPRVALLCQHQRWHLLFPYSWLLCFAARSTFFYQEVLLNTVLEASEKEYCYEQGERDLLKSGTNLPRACLGL